MTRPLLFQEALKKLETSWQGLPDKPDENPLSTLCALWNFVTHTNPSPVDDIMQLHPLDQESADKLLKLVEKRISGVPLAYLIGSQTYLDLEFAVSPAAMIPRKETELLGKTAIKLARRLADERGRLGGVDLCTGSGNVVLSLANYVPEYRAFASDISPDAIVLAEKNAIKLGLVSRVIFTCGDLYEPFQDPKYEHVFDLITCNPPYIATGHIREMAKEISSFEPQTAFDGGPFGVNFIMRLIRETPKFLKASSWLVFEVGSGQGKSVIQMLKKTGKYQKVQHENDENGEIRVVLAQSF